MPAEDWPVEVHPIFHCWNWKGKTDKRDGSGIIWRGKTPIAAYIIVYETERGPVPPGLVRDHTCRNRACCNPAHIELVTKNENEMRKSWRYRCRIKKCQRGHSMSNAMVTPEGGRVCRTCSQTERSA